MALIDYIELDPPHDTLQQQQGQRASFQQAADIYISTTTIAVKEGIYI